MFKLCTDKDNVQHVLLAKGTYSGLSKGHQEWVLEMFP